MTAESDQIAALRRELELIWAAHEREHKAHEVSHTREHEFSQEAVRQAAILAKENKADANEWRASMTDREARFSTKEDVAAIIGRLDGLERAALVATERDRQRLLAEADEKQQSGDRMRRSQWMIGLLVGILASVGSFLLSIAFRQ